MSGEEKLQEVGQANPNEITHARKLEHYRYHSLIIIPQMDAWAEIPVLSSVLGSRSRSEA